MPIRGERWYLPQGQHAEFVAPGNDEGGQETYVGELEQALLGGYPSAAGLLEPRVRAAGHGAVEREEQGRVGSVVVRVIIIVVAGRPVRRGRAVLHRGRCCTAGSRRRARAIAGRTGAAAVAVAAADAAGSRGADGGADRVPQSGGGGQ